MSSLPDIYIRPGKIEWCLLGTPDLQQDGGLLLYLIGCNCKMYLQAAK